MVTIESVETMNMERDLHIAFFENLQASFENILNEKGEIDEVSVKKYVEQLFVNHIKWYPMPFDDLRLYRARYDNGFDNTDIFQFGYIQNAEVIKPLRYNLAQEQVLYTSTHPGVAYKEIAVAKPSTYFYLSLWNKKVTENNTFKTFFNIPSKLHNLNGNAKKYAGVLMTVITPRSLEYYWSKHLGDLLEGDCLTGYNKDYILSSNIAHKIFSQCDILLSVSQKSENKELNLNFSKEAAEKLECKTIFRCKSPSTTDGELLLFEVDKIAFCSGSTITWCNFEIDSSTIIPCAQDSCYEHWAQQAQYNFQKGIKPSQIRLGTMNHYDEHMYIMACYDGYDIGFKAKLKFNKI